MNLNRRELLQGTALAGTAVGFHQTAAGETGKHEIGRKPRTIYFNDARHYYLYVFDPPMSLLDAWRPVDEVAGTAVNTFVYGVARGDGLFYPSKIGLRFATDMRPLTSAYAWRTWENMQSLMDRGLDPLKVLIDRAHQKGMDFFASLRMSSYGGMKKQHLIKEGGRGLAHQEVRDHQFQVLQELATEYDVEGVELDFAAAPGGMQQLLLKEDVAEFTPVLTDYVETISQMVRSRPGEPGQVGARVYPTEEMNRAHGLDVRTWLKRGLVDYLVPMLYINFTLDVDMPVGWLVQAAHEYQVSVYGMLMPFSGDEATGLPAPVHATPAQLRAAAANYWARDVDGLYTWFMSWPLGDTERGTLTELGDPDLIREADKHYIVHRRSEEADKMGYQTHLPLEIPSANPDKIYTIPFSVADDVAGSQRIQRVLLRIHIDNLVSADRLNLRLNGESLNHEPCQRDFGSSISPYSGQWLEIELIAIRPRQGRNRLEIALDGRPRGLEGGLTVQHVELLIEYGPFPAHLSE